LPRSITHFYRWLLSVVVVEKDATTVTRVLWARVEKWKKEGSPPCAEGRDLDDS